jgi:SNF2 family DNA or RNA helicase
MTLRFQDYIDIPAAQYLKRYVELTSKQEKQYKELEKDFVLSLNATDSVEAFTSASLAGKLLQFCNGAIYDAEQKVIPVHDEKIQELKQVIEDNPDENFLIAYNYKHDLERLQKALPKAKTLSKSGEEIDAWNKEKIKYLLAHPASAGHGLNLQHGGNTIIWFGLNWNLELYEQFNARLYRQGQKDQVKIIHLVAKGCLDEKVLEALESKAKTQDDLKNYLKKTLH